MGKSLIHFHSEDVAFSLKNKTLIRNWIAAVIKKEKKRQGEINFIFCSDDYLLQMNRSYLDHDTLTDIITFDYSGEGEQGNRDQESRTRVTNSKDSQLSGDIFISIDRVRENAEKLRKQERLTNT